MGFRDGNGAISRHRVAGQSNRRSDRAAEGEGRRLSDAVARRTSLDAYFSASKLAWIINNIPAAKEALDAGRLRLGTTDAFFLDRLTGHFATDVTTASRTSLMTLETGQWDEDLCALFGVPIACLPEIRPTVADFGSINGVPVTAAVVDQQARSTVTAAESPATRRSPSERAPSRWP